MNTRDTAWVNGKDVPLVARDCDISAGKEPLARFVKALVHYRGFFTDSMYFGDWDYSGRKTFFFRIFIPEPHLEAFVKEARPEHVALPPEIKLS